MISGSIKGKPNGRFLVSQKEARENRRGLWK